MVRAGKPLKVELAGIGRYPTLVSDLHGEYPSYFVYGPMVFSRATRQFLCCLRKQRQPAARLGFLKSPLVTRAFDPPSAELEELVIISSPFFPHKLANGYSNPAGSVVYSVNGTQVMSLKQLVALLRDLKDPFVTLEFGAKGGEALVFSRPALVAATDDILTDNGVRAQGSPDMHGGVAGKAEEQVLVRRRPAPTLRAHRRVSWAAHPPANMATDGCRRWETPSHRPCGHWPRIATPG